MKNKHTKKAKLHWNSAYNIWQDKHRNKNSKLANKKLKCENSFSDQDSDSEVMVRRNYSVQSEMRGVVLVWATNKQFPRNIVWLL